MLRSKLALLEQHALEHDEVLQRHDQSLQEVREHTGLQLKLPEVVKQIKVELGLDAAMTTAAVLAHAQEEHGVKFEKGWNMRRQVQSVCDELTDIETGWTEAATAAAAAPLASAAQPDRAALLFGDSGDVVDEADLC
jgi:hypothetical protein